MVANYKAVSCKLNPGSVPSHMLQISAKRAMKIFWLPNPNTLPRANLPNVDPCGILPVEVGVDPAWRHVQSEKQ